MVCQVANLGKRSYAAAAPGGIGSPEIYSLSGIPCVGVVTVEDKYVESAGTTNRTDGAPPGCSLVFKRGVCPRCNRRSQAGRSSCEPDWCRFVRRGQTTTCAQPRRQAPSH